MPSTLSRLLLFVRIIFKQHNQLSNFRAPEVCDGDVCVIIKGFYTTQVKIFKNSPFKRTCQNNIFRVASLTLKSLWVALQTSMDELSAIASDV